MGAVGIGSVAAVCLVVALQRSNGTRPRRASADSREIIVDSGANLQQALNSAKFGETIVLEAGATYSGNFILPYKGEGSGTDQDYITIRTSELGAIPPEGQRVKPALHAKAMPKIVSASSDPALRLEQKAHHYKFIGVEFSVAATTKYVYNLIDIGTYEHTSLPQMPHHVVFDRCYVHSPGLGRARRGFALNGGETWITNSHVSGFAGEGDETQAIAGWNGPGPMHIINNYLEGGAEVILIGGADPNVPDLVPSDIEIRNNYLTRPAEWAGKVSIKGTFELKNARRVIVDGNVLESTTPRMTAFVLTVRNQGGRAPWSTIQDVQITNNISRHASAGMNILGKDDQFPSTEAKNIRIANNLFIDVESPGESSYFLQMSGGESVTVEHNTVQQIGNILSVYNYPARNFVFRDNIIQYNLYGIVCYIQGAPCQDYPYCRCFSGVTLKGNYIADNANQAASNQIEKNFPAGNFILSSYDQFGFIDYRQGNWRLAPGSKLRGRATDGKDPGVNFAEFDKSGVNSAVDGKTP